MDSIGLVICLLITENHTTRRTATIVSAKKRAAQRDSEEVWLLTLALIGAGRLPSSLAGATALALALSDGVREERLLMR